MPKPLRRSGGNFPFGNLPGRPDMTYRVLKATAPGEASLRNSDRVDRGHASSTFGRREAQHAEEIGVKRALCCGGEGWPSASGAAQGAVLEALQEPVIEIGQSIL